jgi:hypothetical protein
MRATRSHRAAREGASLLASTLDASPTLHRAMREAVADTFRLLHASIAAGTHPTRFEHAFRND